MDYDESGGARQGLRHHPEVRKRRVGEELAKDQNRGKEQFQAVRGEGDEDLFLTLLSFPKKT